MKILLIDAKNRTQNVLDIENDYDFLKSQMESGFFTSGAFIKKDGIESVLYVDDEGLILEKEVYDGFIYNDYFFAGNGVVIGVDKDGYSISTNIDNLSVEFTSKSKKEVNDFLDSHPPTITML